MKQEILNLFCFFSEGNLKKCAEEECSRVLIAEGEKMVEGTDDKIEFKFASEKKQNKFKVDETGNIDFTTDSSVAGTAWAYFYHVGLNPFKLTTLQSFSTSKVIKTAKIK
jgi:hypothetical protein